MSVENPELPSVSVVIAVYNGAAWIRESLDGILAQTYPAQEVWVVDDGSTDGTAGVVQSYKNPIRYEFHTHRGQPAARNAGIRKATGDLIAFIDADDYWHPKKLEMQINLIRARKLSWVGCDVEWFDNSKRRIYVWTPPLCEGDVLKSLFLGNFIISPTPMVRREVFNQVGYFNESPEARIGEDWDMWLRIAAQFPLGVVWEKLAYMRSHSASMIATSSIKERVRGLERVVERAAGREPERLLPLRAQALANIYYGAAVQFMKQNQYPEARASFLDELHYRPTHIQSWIYLILTMLGPRISNPVIALKRQIMRPRNEPRK